MTHTEEIRAARDRIQSRAPRRAELVAVLAGTKALEERAEAMGELARIDEQDAADGRVLASTHAIIDGSRPERMVHRALKNLFDEWGLTRQGIIAEAVKAIKIEATDAKTVVEMWMNGNNMREFVSKVARETVQKLADPILRAEARAFFERVQVSVSPPKAQ